MAADIVSCRPLHLAALHGPEAAVRLLLEAAPAAAMAADALGCLPLHWAAQNRRMAAVCLLLEAAPEAASAAAASVWLPLHYAAVGGHELTVRLLLQAAPQAAMAATAEGWLPLHFAADCGHGAAVRLLLEAAPQAAATITEFGTPLQLALTHSHTHTHTAAARALLAAGPAAAVLSALAAAGAFALALFPDFLSAPGRLPLAAAHWALVPSPCPGIQRALPAALACDTAQAAQVVRRLPPAEAACLRCAALCLHRRGLTSEVAALILAHCAAEAGERECVCAGARMRLGCACGRSASQQLQSCRCPFASNRCHPRRPGHCGTSWRGSSRRPRSCPSRRSSTRQFF